MLNGDGIRVTLLVAGCEHHCKNCQNPFTWDVHGGIPFDKNAYDEICEDLKQYYCAGLTLSGGDPMHTDNRDTILTLCKNIKIQFPTKTIWMYTGYTFEEIKTSPILQYIDVLVDGEYMEQLRNVEAHWVGSTNQRIILVQETFKQNKIVTIQN
jgi:anaerobic ribonucleoside-triphosphate reductase activating protein